jgi:DNA-binding response OmpR family regulator
MSSKRALIVATSRDLRLYLRARLSLAKLTQADEAESGVHAVELARGNQYDVALVDHGLTDMDAWALLKTLRQGKKPIPHVAMTNTGPSLPDHVRGWLAGAEALLGRPPHPARLQAWLSRF